MPKNAAALKPKGAAANKNEAFEDPNNDGVSAAGQKSHVCTGAGG